MWPFKKKEIILEYDISSENRFMVEIKKDNNEYYIEVYDWWSRLFYNDEEGKKHSTVHTRNITMQKVKDYKEVLKNVEEMKDNLRKQFIKKRALQCKPKKRREVKTNG